MKAKKPIAESRLARSILPTKVIINVGKERESQEVLGGEDRKAEAHQSRLPYPLYNLEQE